MTNKKVTELEKQEIRAIAELDNPRIRRTTIAKVYGITRQYVYKILSDNKHIKQESDLTTE